MLTNYLALNIDQLVSKVAEHGFCVMDDFITPANTLALSNEITLLNDHLQMQEAGTGRAQNIDNQLRGDVIYWLNESNPTPAQQAYFSQMEILRASLNQHLYLGLFALESHLALYTAGTGYKKHIDRFKVSSNYPTSHQPVRQISCILYLNQDWLAEDGGELRLYLNSSDETIHIAAIDRLSLDISPLGGRLVVFLSDTFYHEVLSATQDRKSLTGWFLTR